MGTNSLITDDQLKAQLSNVLEETNFGRIGEKYQGKVRDCYIRGAERVLITTDRLSCFDRVVTTIPFKGEVLNAIALHWFSLAQPVIDNHLIDVPDPNVVVAKSCKVLPVEVVVRGYLAGSAWKDYTEGRTISGVKLPLGLKNAAKFEKPILTPATKAAVGEHDQPISEQEILSSGMVAEKLWHQVREVALQLFDLGQSEANKRGLLLADTKYEFGLFEDKLLLVDEIHTLDCSRYWVAESWESRMHSGEPQEMLDKQPIREWLIEHGFRGEGPIPKFSEELRCSIARHYLDSFARIVGTPLSLKVEPVLERVERALSARLAET